MDAGYREAVWSWSRHLASGGTTPWTRWCCGPTGPDDPARAHSATARGGSSAPADWTPPGAGQLELLRRLAVRRSQAEPVGGPTVGPVPGASGFEALADVVVGRSGPGRGLAEQPLLWGSADPPRTGAPPVDPADLPRSELVRLATGVLTELSLGASSGAWGASPFGGRDRDEADPDGPDSWARSPRSSASSWRLVGAPLSVRAVRRRLTPSAPVTRAPLVVVLAAPLDHALAQVWSTRVQGGGVQRWVGFLDRCAVGDVLPRSVDPARLARDWSQRLGADRVRVVVQPPGDAGPDAVTLVGSTLAAHESRRRRPPWAHRLLAASGLSTGSGGLVPPDGTGPQDLDAGQVQALRRVNEVLVVRADPERQVVARAVAARALAQRRAGAGERHRLTVPERHLEWARATGRRLAEELEAGGYPVAGRVQDLLPAHDGVPRPRPQDTLAALLDGCLALAPTPAAPQSGSASAPGTSSESGGRR